MFFKQKYKLSSTFLILKIDIIFYPDPILMYIFGKTVTLAVNSHIPDNIKVQIDKTWSFFDKSSSIPILYGPCISTMHHTTILCNSLSDIMFVWWLLCDDLAMDGSADVICRLLMVADGVPWLVRRL